MCSPLWIGVNGPKIKEPGNVFSRNWHCHHLSSFCKSACHTLRYFALLPQNRKPGLSVSVSLCCVCVCGVGFETIFDHFCRAIIELLFIHNIVHAHFGPIALTWHHRIMVLALILLCCRCCYCSSSYFFLFTPLLECVVVHGSNFLTADYEIFCGLSAFFA